MVAPARTLLLALTLTLPSCYLAHGRSSEPAERPDAGRAVRRDAGRPAPLSDGGREPPARDAGPPLPPEPDPDLGPGTRPSEYPDAEEWTEPPPLGEDDPCCELDEPVRVLSREDGVVVAYERPSLAWGPGRWGSSRCRSSPSATGTSTTRAASWWSSPPTAARSARTSSSSRPPRAA
ncbi:MAG: hypothetical protein M5U28_06020 [Sandaracinaceae bacterium]|nr:hypothetical protein [Sandaracinaceae bacterium]